MNKSLYSNLNVVLKNSGYPMIRIADIKEITGIKSDTEAIRFCVTFTYRNLYKNKGSE